MIDFWLEREIDWVAVFAERSPDLLREAWERVESLRSPTPFVDQVETTNYCPLTCVMCPRGQGRMTRRNGHMDAALFRRVAYQIEEGWVARKGTERDPTNLVEAWPRQRIEAGGLRLHHFGSPLLDPQFIARVEWLKLHCSFPVHASISAEHLHGEMAPRLIASGIDRLLVALDGESEESYRSVRGPAASYGRAVVGIEALLEARARLGARTAIDLQMIDLGCDPGAVERFRERWIGAGVEVLIKPLFPYPDIGPELPLAKEWPNPCSFPFVTMVVTVDGRVVPCCSDYDAEEVVGDAQVESLQDIWCGERFLAFRRRFFFERASADSLCGRCGHYGREVGGKGRRALPLKLAPNG